MLNLNLYPKSTKRTRKVNNGVCVSVLMKSNAASPLLCSGVCLDESSLALPDTKQVNCDLP